MRDYWPIGQSFCVLLLGGSSEQGFWALRFLYEFDLTRFSGRSSPQPAAYCLLPTAYCLLPTAYCLLPTAYCLLPAAYCLLPTAYFLLPTAYFILGIRLAKSSAISSRVQKRTPGCEIM